MKAFFIFALLCFASSGFALPLGQGKAPQYISDEVLANYDFEGVIEIGNCSGSLIRFENSVASDPAVVLTNGHCLEKGFMKPGTFVANAASVRSLSVFDSAGTPGKLTTTTLMYATMTGSDISIYKLKETYADIEKMFKIRPLTLSPSIAYVGDEIEIISGYWKRGYACKIETFVEILKEDKWEWIGSIRYSRPGCATISGVSGSPIILLGTRTVVGVHNTLNEGGQKCSQNNPCEVDKNGNISYVKGYGYAQQTYQIYTCLNAKNEIDLTISGCQLFH